MIVNFDDLEDIKLDKNCLRIIIIGGIIIAVSYVFINNFIL